MPITAEQRERRRSFVGSSDIAALLEMDPFQNKHGVFMEKMYGTSDISSEAMEIGDMVEEPLVRWAAEEHGFAESLIFGPETMVHENGIMAVNLDGLAPAETMFEAKYTSVGEEWGDPGSDEVPDRVIAQCQFAMACVPTIRVAYVPAFITRANRLTKAIYVVERNTELIEAIETIATDFMVNHVRCGRPPEDSPPPSWDTLKRIRRREDVEVHVADELVQTWLDKKAERLHIEKGVKTEESEAKNAVIAAMRDGTVGLCSMGKVVMTRVNKKAYSVDASSHWRTGFKEGE